MTPLPQCFCNAAIYEMNIRQITPSGTFAAAQAELTRLKNIGVDVVWVMPIQPIGVQERKGTLGSYYAISDYTGFNPEFGNRVDFQRFVDCAHTLGLKVILDWVANHTSPDHVWTKHEGWHKRNDNGSLKVQYDWTDIAELNYDNADMRLAMADAMKFWLTELHIDGFRCDMAMLVPTDFWEYAAAELRKVKPDLLLLAEAESPDLMQNAFNIHYAWELHHAMNDVAQGKISADALWDCIEKQRAQFPQGAVPLIFTSNHDENSWNGTAFERMGEQGAMAFAAFCYIVRGTPLIYTGQETGNRHRLAFFEKDNIERVPNAPQAKFYTALNALRKAHPALWSNGDMFKINNSIPQHIFSALRKQGDNSVIGVFNFSGYPLTVRFDDANFQGKFLQFGDNREVALSPNQELQMQAWEYKIFYSDQQPATSDQLTATN
jgi:glycosidase